MRVNTSPLFMGLDLSTQQLKAVVVDDELQVQYRASVHFDSDLPEFRTHGGVVRDKNRPENVTVPTLLWVKALDMLMDRLVVCGVEFSKIVAVSGTAQQHGTVYWQNGSKERLRKLDSAQFLHQQLASTFSVTDGPVWMDSSTGEECRLLERAVEGAHKLAEITGSKAYERFSGPQIAKIIRTRPEAYDNAERISLVSSFLCSLFLGKVAPIDYSDASGMNLMDLRGKKWERRLIDVCALDLAYKLGDPVPSCTNLGTISAYFVERWDFDAECKVSAFTGDNAASLIGMGIREGWLAISLGTSDTLFLWLERPEVAEEGHIFCNPADPDAYMALLCFKNGSLTRERIRNECAEGSWDIFNQLLESTPRGNFGNMGLYYDSPEIIPPLLGDYRYNKAGDKIGKFASLEVEVRALVEGQFVGRRAHAEDMGFHVGKDTKILATGGGCANKPMLQVLSDVFNAPVYVQETPDSAAIGAAYQAKLGLTDSPDAYNQLISRLSVPRLTCEPYRDAPEIYESMVSRYRTIVSALTKK